MPIAALLVLILCLIATVAVFQDARARLPRPAAIAWTLATLVTAGLAAPIYLLIRPSRAAMWGLSEVLALPLFLAMSLLVLIVVLGEFTTVRPDTLSSIWVIVVLAVIQNAAFVAAALYVVLVKYRLPLARLGLAAGPWARRLRAGVLAAIAALVGNTLGQSLTVLLVGLAIGRQAANELVNRKEANLPIYQILKQFHHPREILILAVLVGLVVPIGEEIFFRGLTYGALRSMMNRHTAALVSALFFAALHLEPVEFLPILILGTILAYVYDFTGSLVPGMIAHAVNNLTALVVFYMSPLPSP